MSVPTHPTRGIRALAIGWRDPEAAANNFKRQRVPLDEQVRFFGFE